MVPQLCSRTSSNTSIINTGHDVLDILAVPSSQRPMRTTIKVLLLHILWVVSGLKDTCTICPIMTLTIMRYHRRYLPIPLPALFP